MAKTQKICVVCAGEFQGTKKSETCGATCRKRLQRLREAGKKPEYALIGGKNTKLGAVKKANSEPKKNVELDKEPPKTQEASRRPFMSDAMKKRLGW